MKKTIAFITLTLILTAACAAPPASVPQAATATPAATDAVAPTSEAMPPRDDPTPAATEEGLQLDSTLLPRPTPAYFAPLAEALPAGVVSETLASPLVAADGLQVLYLNGSLHVWDVAGQTDTDLGWPAHAVDCLMLGSDGKTLYFTDQRGVSAIDLTAVVSPTLLVEHYIDDNNSARNRQFCTVGQSNDGAALLLQAHDRQWYQLGVLSPESNVLRVVESPLGPPGEPWNCPGSIAWGQEDTILLSGYSVGSCIQAPGLFKTEWGGPLVPSPVLTGTLPALGDRLPQRAGAWHLTPNADHSRVAFWFDQDYAREDGAFLKQVLTVVDGMGDDPVQLTDPIPGRNGPPVWSADGESLYIATSEQFDVLDPHPWQIRRIGLDGADQVVAEFDARFALLAGPERDGKLLLLLLNDQLTYGVHVLDIASGEIQNGPAGVAVVGWLP